MHVAIVRHVYNRFDMANCLIRISIQAAAMSMHSITVYKISGAGLGGRGNRNHFYHGVYIKRGVREPQFVQLSMEGVWD